MTDQQQPIDQAPAADAAAPDAVLFDQADVLADLRGELEHVGDVELAQRPALLERANAALVQALAELEEV